MIASEATPFASTGGLGDVLDSLPKALAASGHEIAVLLPLYQKAVLEDPRVVYERLTITVGVRRYTAKILEQTDSHVRYFFVHLPELFDRPEIYGDYSDSHIRFAALSEAALGVARHLFSPGVIHAHDWPAALVPVLLKNVYTRHPAYLGIKTVLTIHNLAYQGIFPREALSDLGLPERLVGADLLDFQGRVNFLKGAVLASGQIATVSPTYAREIQTPEGGFGLDGVMRMRKNDLTGILNGADYQSWNPESDSAIAQPFSREQLEGKLICKEQLLAEAGLPADGAERPVIAIVSRFAEQKGLDLLASIPHELAAAGISLIAMGNGDPAIEDFFRWFASAYPKQVSVHVGYDPALAHRILAGSDMLLMPSRYEPCGLTQLYAMRYGTLPLVRATGGLNDTVDADTGFRFWSATPEALLECVRTAVRTHAEMRWSEMMRAAMQREFSWAQSARRYTDLYGRTGSQTAVAASPTAG